MVGCKYVGIGQIVAVVLDGTILVQHLRPDGEQLHQLARVILVGERARGGISHGVVGHVEILAHGWTQRHVAHDLPVIGKRVGQQHVLEQNHILVPDQLLERRYEDLAERERDSLAQLIRISHGVGQEMRRHPALAGCNGVVIGNLRQVELLRQPALEAERLHVGGVARRGAESGLFEEPPRGSGRDLRVRHADLHRQRVATTTEPLLTVICPVPDRLAKPVAVRCAVRESSPQAASRSSAATDEAVKPVPVIVVVKMPNGNAPFEPTPVITGVGGRRRIQRDDRGGASVRSGRRNRIGSCGRHRRGAV